MISQKTITGGYSAMVQLNWESSYDSGRPSAVARDLSIMMCANFEEAIVMAPPMGNAFQVQRTIHIRETVAIQQQATQITNKMRLSELCSVRKV